MPMLVQFIDHRNGMVSEADPAVAGTILTQVEFGGPRASHEVESREPRRRHLTWLGNTTSRGLRRRSVR